MQNVQGLLKRYQDNKAKAEAEAEGSTFKGVGMRRGVRRTPRGRAQWTKSFVQGGNPARGVGAGKPGTHTRRTSRGGPHGRGIGQASSAAIPTSAGDVVVYPGPDGGWYPEGHPKCPIDQAGPPTGMGCDSPSPCGVNVIGGNTFGTNGIAPAATGTLVITAGDAGYFHPKAIYFEGMPWATQDLIDLAALPVGCCTVPVYLVDALIGRVSMLRRGGAANVALTQGAFANTKELVAVDWGEFVSTNEQNLSLLFYNPNQNQTIHAAFVTWGDI